MILNVTCGNSAFTVTVKTTLRWIKDRKNKDCVFVVGRLTCCLYTDSKVSGEIKGTEERRRRGEKVWFHMQVAVKDVYLKGPISLLSPKLERNKSLVQFTRADGPISSGDPDYPNRLRVIMSTSVFIWDFTLAFIGGLRGPLCKSNAYRVLLKKRALGTFTVGTWVQTRNLLSRCLKIEFETSRSAYTSRDRE